jgi:Tol biopolymer transport system component
MAVSCLALFVCLNLVQGNLMRRHKLETNRKSHLLCVLFSLSFLLTIPSYKAASTFGETAQSVLSFMAIDGEVGSLYITNITTGDIHLIRNDIRYNVCPVWSANGTQLLLSSTSSSGAGSINLISIDEPQKDQLITLANVGSLQWNQIENSIIYDSMDDNGKSNIYQYFLGTKVRRQLTNNDASILPKLSADGNYVAYLVHHGQVPELHILKKEGNGFVDQFIANVSGINSNFAWSPDGKEIAFISTDSDIYLASLPDFSTQKLTSMNYKAETLGLAWSPDASKIAFVSTLNSVKPQIHSVTVKDLNIQLVTTDSLYPKEMAWSPSARYIAYTSQPDLGNDIMLFDLQNSVQRRLTNDINFKTCLFWLPKFK